MTEHSTSQPGADATTARRPAWPRPFIGDLSGAFADLGTFLPLVVGIIAIRGFDAAGVLIGFGLFAFATALVYRRPIPVQPMKVISALIIASGLSAEAMAASGLLIGIVLCVLAVTGAVTMMARLVPFTVMIGVTVGVGLYLALLGARLLVQDPLVGAVAAAGLAVIWLTPARPLASLAVLLGGIVWGVAQLTGEWLAPAIGFHLPVPVLPDAGAFRIAALEAVLPQLVLTLTNAVLVSATIAANYFPDDRARLSPVRFAYTTGLLNIVLAPLGAIPMCHGAGGLVVQYRFGARSALAPLLFGAACLALGVLYGPAALDLLQLVPLAAVGVLLGFAGLDLALNRRLRNQGTAEIMVIVVTAATCVVFNVAVGLVAGWLVHGLLAWIGMRRRAR